MDSTVRVIDQTLRQNLWHMLILVGIRKMFAFVKSVAVKCITHM